MATMCLSQIGDVNNYYGRNNAGIILKLEKEGSRNTEIARRNF